MEGCDCEAVQRPTMGQNAAWSVLAQRYKAVHTHGQRPPLFDPLSTGENAPQELRVKERRNSPGERRGTKAVEVAPPRDPGTRSGCPAVLAVPARVAQRHKPVGSASRAGTAIRQGGAGDARDVLRKSLSSPVRAVGRLPGASLRRR